MKITIEVDEAEIRATYGTFSKDLAFSAYEDILFRYANREYFDPEIRAELTDEEWDNEVASYE